MTDIKNDSSPVEKVSSEITSTFVGDRILERIAAEELWKFRPEGGAVSFNERTDRVPNSQRVVEIAREEIEQKNDPISVKEIVLPEHDEMEKMVARAVNRFTSQAAITGWIPKEAVLLTSKLTKGSDIGVLTDGEGGLNLDNSSQDMVHGERFATSFELEALEFGLRESGVSDTDSRKIRNADEENRQKKLRDFTQLRKKLGMDDLELEFMAMDTQDILEEAGLKYTYIPNLWKGVGYMGSYTREQIGKSIKDTLAGLNPDSIRQDLYRKREEFEDRLKSSVTSKP